MPTPTAQAQIANNLPIESVDANVSFHHRFGVLMADLTLIE
jgi:hypothetical protein